jgi:hypothetical protein
VSDDWWTRVGVVCGAIIAVITLGGIIIRKVRRVLKAISALVKRLNRMADDLEGDRVRGVRSLREEIVQLRGEVGDLSRRVTEHQEWHSVAGRGNGVRDPAPKS